MKFRQSGIFLPIFSLPSNYGIGDIGKAAMNFIDFLSESGFSYWSLLPLGPTSIGDSPFQSFSSRALNPYFIDLDDLIDKGLLKKKDLSSISWGDDDRQIDYQKIFEHRIKVLKIAFKRFKKGEGDYQRGYTIFIRKKEFSDYACFMVLKERNEDKAWNEFSNSYNVYSSEKFKQFKRKYRKEIEFYEWTQYIFLKQWQQLKNYAESKHVQIIGIMPMHLSHDSIDVYKHHRDFILNAKNEMDVVAGYPPDVFYAKGQNWGMPLYNFDYLKKNNYKLFKDRLSFNLNLYDVVILNHFRGYLENYVIQSDAKDGLNGQWTKTEGDVVVSDFVSDMDKVVAENVDCDSTVVNNAINKLHIKDTKVVEFGFPREEGNFNQPINFKYSTISFSSTHDCMPLKAYFEQLNESDQRKAIEQINKNCEHFGVEKVMTNSSKEVVDALLELNLASLSSIAIQSMSDLLYQGKESRINTPGSVGNNWKYRVTNEDLSPLNAKRLRDLNKKYGRCD